MRRMSVMSAMLFLAGAFADPADPHHTSDSGLLIWITIGGVIAVVVLLIFLVFRWARKAGEFDIHE